MKLRRAMAVAAATAVIAPAAFFSAPAAFATDGENSPPPAASEAPESTEPAAPETTEASVTPPATGEAPEEGKADEEKAPQSSEEAPAPGTELSEPEGTKPSEPAPASSGSTTKPTTEPSDGPVECVDTEEGIYDDQLQTSLSGLPERIVAGSGFHSFKLNVTNKGKNDYERVDLGVFAFQIDEKAWDPSTGHLTLQYKDPESGVWTPISLDDNDAGAGYLGYTGVKAKESFSVDLRLSVAKSAPAGLGYAVSIGVYANDEGNCVYSDDESFYEFDIVAAGTDPGDPNEAKPQEGGKKPLPAKPAGNTEIKPQGHLAETGSSSVVPVIGMAGGIAIVAGAGVMFAMKRRRSDAAA
ncbi:hypothetical protein OIE62_25595 [Streptomyces scopuliridis]|uniref:Uncharacterized protein n=1 Tax=Streptomyces scopuliridis TaxID=452529 RepID=A0ACD4ZIX8_9ACTN|nr:hypothetical protein [Streptomyces scopuliridis]WSB98262.1 hypothetical protein OG835_15345 [Streptomyces scopuliridis]WSC08036.1 hypothetical protein OIE62_25595 [Streptomyces scopuliridis]